MRSLCYGSMTYHAIVTILNNFEFLQVPYLFSLKNTSVPVVEFSMFSIGQVYMQKKFFSSALFGP